MITTIYVLYTDSLMLDYVTVVLPFDIIPIYNGTHSIQDVEESMLTQHNQTGLHGHPQGLERGNSL